MSCRQTSRGRGPSGGRRRIRSTRGLVALEDVAGVDFGGDIIEEGVVAVGDDGMGEGLEGGEVVDDLGTEEGGAIRKGGFVDDDFGTLGLDAFHDALNG